MTDLQQVCWGRRVLLDCAKDYNLNFAGPGRQPGYFRCKAPKKVPKEMACCCRDTTGAKGCAPASFRCVVGNGGSSAAPSATRGGSPPVKEDLFNTAAAGKSTPTTRFCLRCGLWFGLRFSPNNTLLPVSQEEQRPFPFRNPRRRNSRMNPAAGRIGETIVEFAIRRDHIAPRGEAIFCLLFVGLDKK